MKDPRDSMEEMARLRESARMAKRAGETERAEALLGQALRMGMRMVAEAAHRPRILRPRVETIA